MVDAPRAMQRTRAEMEAKGDISAAGPFVVTSTCKSTAATSCVPAAASDGALAVSLTGSLATVEAICVSEGAPSIRSCDTADSRAGDGAASGDGVICAGKGFTLEGEDDAALLSGEGKRSGRGLNVMVSCTAETLSDVCSSASVIASASVISTSWSGSGGVEAWPWLVTAIVGASCGS